jgi:hypothetical protein
MYLKLQREKTSQAFRDALHSHYKSSNFSKKQHRLKVRGSRKRQTSDASVRETETLASSSFSNQCIGNMNTPPHITQILDLNSNIHRNIKSSPTCEDTKKISLVSIHKLDEPKNYIHSRSIRDLMGSTLSDTFNFSTDNIISFSQVCRTSPSDTSLSSENWFNEDNTKLICDVDDIQYDELPTASELCSLFTVDGRNTIDD